MWSSKNLNLPFLEFSMNYYAFIEFQPIQRIKEKEKPLKT
jgi:hypothetical protein